MSNRSSAQSVIDSYRKRQQMGPVLIGGLAVLLVIIGIVVLVMWLLNGSGGSPLAFLSSPTPTETATATVTPTPTVPTPTPSATPTISPTPTIEMSPTPSGPFLYRIQEGDVCWTIADNFDVDVNVLLAINGWAPGDCPIRPGDDIWIPLQGQTLPTFTPVPTEFRGEINYVVQIGDTIADLAYIYYTSVDDIVARNNLEDVNDIKAGDTLVIRPYIATRAPTFTPAVTRGPVDLTGSTPTLPAATATQP